ncbi:hypothetical protein E5F05_06575 [Deinococcus metallilatus]|uniref:Lipocalin-like domain-containing protein n=1 Tax=Deinococcus metallilatus TaxID=1211322 RepID=A0AAJ5F6L1_9DEIO|nr:hypothetical protein [Deinococcus metallilatus]MBB5294611.1 hypothetical protein [Deinococcus metallilatus]QBY07650.1 hypothetical protein E5F05_06575 [Deinococcus metallilatus]RXJ14066.1 hypothetical protein ERJ73_05410 [Deinococcus metallilatus]TLK30031.1 hypothetical protein FCS05_05725 [Deinococcus metallilatus]GMA15824.1 hypothetical protein GCM10025871_21550 [Deinococcus metallilatus]
MKKLLLLPALVLGLSACGGSAPPLAAPTIDVTGTWVATLNGTLLPLQIFQFNLTQRGNAVSGQAGIVPDPSVGPPPYTYEPFGRVSGTVSGNQFNFTAYGSGDYAGSVTLSGTLAGGKLTGTWTNISASGWSDAGTFTAVPSN